MIDKKTLGILVCPQNRTPLQLADEQLLAEVNAAIASGRVRNQGGAPVERRLEGALVRQDKVLLYPIVDDIPVLLVDEAISLDQID